MSNEELNPEAEMLFPAAFSRWSGAKESAVKTPFTSVKSPIKRTIETTLVARLRNWAKNIVSGESEPRAVFLVGGAGNGKSEAIEFVIREIASHLDTGDELLRFFQGEFSINEQRKFFERKVVFPGKIGQYNGLVLVQDASVRDHNQYEKKIEQLLCEDITDIIQEDDKKIYLFCVNRGVFAQALVFASDVKLHDIATQVLETISRAVTLSPFPVDAWPLDNYDEIAVWPMDVESLVDGNLYSGEASPVSQILSCIADKEKWMDHSNCPHKKYCPFKFNQDTLAKPQYRESFSKLLYYFEIVSGKRWNFREIYAVISHIMLGPDHTFRVGRVNLSPCQWVTKKLESADSLDTWFDLSMKLYHHALFPNWPTFGPLRTEYYKRRPKENAQFSTVNEFFSMLRGWSPDTSSAVARLLAGAFSKALDPASYSKPKTLLGNASHAEAACLEIDEAFSYSIKQGLALKTVSKSLAKCEYKLLEMLDEGSEKLDLLGQLNSKLVGTIKGHIRAFACRIAKRGLGTRNGICKEWEYVNAFIDTVLGQVGDDYKTEVWNLLKGNGESFDMSLVTTFGQPEPPRAKDARLRIPSLKVKVKSVDRPPSSKRPTDSLHFFKVNDFPILLSYELFLAFRQVGFGLVPACLHEKVFSLLDNTKAKLLGELAKDKSILEHLEIRIGTTGETVRFHETNGEARFISQG